MEWEKNNIEINKKSRDLKLFSALLKKFVKQQIE